MIALINNKETERTTTIKRRIPFVDSVSRQSDEGDDMISFLGFEILLFIAVSRKRENEYLPKYDPSF